MSTSMMVVPSPELDGDIRALSKVSPNVHAESAFGHPYGPK